MVTNNKSCHFIFAFMTRCFALRCDVRGCLDSEKRTQISVITCKWRTYLGFLSESPASEQAFLTQDDCFSNSNTNLHFEDSSHIFMCLETDLSVVRWDRLRTNAHNIISKGIDEPRSPLLAFRDERRKETVRYTKRTWRYLLKHANHRSIQTPIQFFDEHAWLGMC